jgi:hypothetical protein
VKGLRADLSVVANRKSLAWYEVLLLFHKWLLGKLPMATMLEMHWLKWMYFHEHALLYLQGCCQGHNPAHTASRRKLFFLFMNSLVQEFKHKNFLLYFHYIY